MAESDQRAWPHWTVEDWNAALFRHFFVIAGPEGLPVTRLAITAEELQRATGDESADPQAVQAAFLRALRTYSPTRFRRALSAEQLSYEGEWTKAVPPPFVVFLLFTCFAASTMEDEVRAEGDFRDRLRILLDHPHHASYALPDLAKLWKAFARWLKRQRSRGDPFRELILPPPGRMVRIGYSTRLAFPPRNDQTRLIRLLAREGFDRDPPIAAVVNAVARGIASFSGTFQDAFEDFRDAFLRGEGDLDRYAFWSAVRDAAGHAQTVLAAAEGRISIQLIGEPDVEGRLELVLMSSGDGGARRGIRFQSTEASVTGFPFVITVDGARDGPQHAVKLLLLGVLSRALPDLRSTPLQVAIEQGVLLFREGEAGIRELATSRPSDGRIQGLIRDDLIEAFLALFPPGERPRAHASRYTSWAEVATFEGAALARIGRTPPPPLSGVRCLQSTVASAQLHISGGIPIAGGYLGLAGLFPVIRINGADAVTVHPVSSGQEELGTEELFRLRPRVEAANTFEFPVDIGPGLDGHFRLVAWAGRAQLAQRQISFRREIVWQGYPAPSSPSAWLVEDGRQDVIAFSAYSGAPEQRIGEESEAIPSRTTASGTAGVAESHIPDDFQLTAEGIPHGRQPLQPPVTIADPAVELDHSIEAFAALASNRKGIPEAQFLDWMAQTLAIDDYSLLWDVVRAWVEAGHFDVLTRRHWKGQVYFAREPHLVCWREAHVYRACLVGLTPPSLRRRVQSTGDRYGARFSSGPASLSPWVPPVISFVADSRVPLERVTSEEGLGAERWLQSLADVIRTVPCVVGAVERVEPVNYEFRGQWDWERRRFTREAAGSESAVQVEWRWRSDLPAVFLVSRSGKPFWWSHSRNWALIVAHALLGLSPFAQVGARHVMRRDVGQIYFPLPLARWITISSGIVPGPAGPGASRYTYAFSSAQARATALDLLFGRRGSEAIIRRARWLLSVVRGRDSAQERVVPVPGPLRGEIERRFASPEMLELASGRVPVFLIPHIRALLSQRKR